MNVCILMPGQARFFKNNNFILEIKKQYNASLFIHTWKNKDNIFTASPYNNMKPFTITSNDLTDYINFFQPTKFFIENELSNEFVDRQLKRDKYEKTSHAQTKYNLYSYLYSLRSCYELSQNLNFDFYIILRSDMVNIKLPKIEENNQKIITTNLIDHTSQKGHKHLAVDPMLLIVPGKFIDTITQLKYKLDEYYDKGYHYNWEEMFYAHLFETGLISNCIHTRDMSFRLRKNENGDLRPKWPPD